MPPPLRSAPTGAWQGADKALTDAADRVSIGSRPWYGRRLALDFRILGPFEVRDGENVLHLGGAKQRGVLAILLLRANEVVSSDRLIDELWGETLLGSFGFDRNGDITESPGTILRVRSRGSSTTIMGVEGGTVARVVRPSAKLVAPEE